MEYVYLTGFPPAILGRDDPSSSFASSPIADTTLAPPIVFPSPTSSPAPTAGVLSYHRGAQPSNAVTLGLTLGLCLGGLLVVAGIWLYLRHRRHRAEALCRTTGVHGCSWLGGEPRLVDPFPHEKRVRGRGVGEEEAVGEGASAETLEWGQAHPTPRASESLRGVGRTVNTYTAPGRMGTPVEEAAGRGANAVEGAPTLPELRFSARRPWSWESTQRRGREEGDRIAAVVSEGPPLSRGVADTGIGTESKA